jgi:hypothetical protein
MLSLSKSKDIRKILSIRFMVFDRYTKLLL